MKNRKMFYAIVLVTISAIVWLLVACSPVREFMTWDEYQGINDFAYPQPPFENTKKTVIIIADNAGTEIFDLLTPFYLFNLTARANVYIVAENKYPIIVRKGLFVLPQLSFEEFDLLKVAPDIVVIPNLSVMNAKDQNPRIIAWIKKHYLATTKMLSVCDGSLTAAATGIYDDKPLTTHSSDYNSVKKQFSKPVWVKDVSVTNSENLFSTAGVTNAVEGSLTVISKVFGIETMMGVKRNISYPHADIKTTHQSIALNFDNKLTIGNKVIFKKNRRVGVLLQEGINEFELASVLDTYNRTFPKSIESFVTSGKKVTSKFGLTIIPTGSVGQLPKLDELHILDFRSLLKEDKSQFREVELVRYDDRDNQYIIDYCLDRINKQYGRKFENITRLLLDYN